MVKICKVIDTNYSIFGDFDVQAAFSLPPKQPAKSFRAKSVFSC